MSLRIETFSGALVYTFKEAQHKWFQTAQLVKKALVSLNRTVCEKPVKSCRLMDGEREVDDDEDIFPLSVVFVCWIFDDGNCTREELMIGEPSIVWLQYCNALLREKQLFDHEFMAMENICLDETQCSWTRKGDKTKYSCTSCRILYSIGSPRDGIYIFHDFKNDSVRLKRSDDIQDGMLLQKWGAVVINHLTDKQIFTQRNHGIVGVSSMFWLELRHRC